MYYSPYEAVLIVKQLSEKFGSSGKRSAIKALISKGYVPIKERSFYDYLKKFDKGEIDEHRGWPHVHLCVSKRSKSNGGANKSEVQASQQPATAAAATVASVAATSSDAAIATITTSAVAMDTPSKDSESKVDANGDANASNGDESTEKTTSTDDTIAVAIATDVVTEAEV